MVFLLIAAIIPNKLPKKRDKKIAERPKVKLIGKPLKISSFTEKSLYL